jgi:hypothetical protein
MTVHNSRSHQPTLPLLAAGLFAFSVLTAPAASRAEEVTVSGCPEPGVEAGCIVLMAENGTLYNVSAAEPKPEIGVVGTATGMVSQAASLCMQGIVLKPATWAPTPGAACPPPKAQ